MKTIILLLSLSISLNIQAQGGYGKIDVGAVIFSDVKPSGAFTIGFKPASQSGIGAKIQYVKDLGFLTMAELRGFIPMNKTTFSGAFNAGPRFKNGNSTFAFGLDASLLLGKNKPFISIGGLFMKEKPPLKIRYNAFYVGTGIFF